MDRILSKDEMNALLNSPAGAGGTAGADDGSAGTRQITVYNFRRPDRLSKGSLRGLQMVYDRFCSSAAASLSAYFRTLTEMSVASIEQSTFNDFLNSLPDPSCLTALNMRPLQGAAVLEIGPDVAFLLIDRLLGGGGGAGEPGNSQRKITEIEKNIIHGVITLLTTDLAEAWKPVTEIRFHPHSSETRPQLMQVTPPHEVVIVVTIELRMGEAKGLIHLCLPFTAMEPILGAFAQEDLTGPKSETAADAAAELPKILRCMLRVPVDVQCELPSTMVAVSDLAEIVKGDILKLDNKIEDRVKVRVGGEPAFDASLMELNGRKGAAILSRPQTGTGG
jgi:flagellar motor switch protein FliM